MKPERNTNATTASEIEARKGWIGILARTGTKQLEQIFSNLPASPRFDYLRQPETGMTMVRARANARGSQFNLGEMTVSRCSVQLKNGPAGHGYVAGRDKRHAELAAIFDALLQQDETGSELHETIATLGNEHARIAKRVDSKTAATKVNFFTMVRGED